MSADAGYEMHPGTLYDYTAGVYCGVLVTEKVMRKLAALQAQHLDAVKRLLTDSHADGEVFPSMWTLHYPEGKQTTVRFIDKSLSVPERIRLASISRQPTAEYPVFIASSMDEAKRMADARRAELNPPAPCPECRENECNGECMEVA
ncbi:hypothetical protein [Stenotrophomonas sp. NPDC078853]|uniref:hypothetical protein n=1 Tax=Stenotrophomonas sp. NPDC078853 TaxID=3364534 RepID=UPI00384FE9A7